VFDGADNQLLGIALPSISSDWRTSRAAFAPVVALGYFGMALGGAAAGLAGDRFGRRSALLGSMLLFGAATLAVAAADTLRDLTVLRFVAGIGLGGAMPNAAALAAEFVPVRQRPFAVTVTIVCVPIGGTIAGLLAIPALPQLGWRALFVIGGVIPILTAIALRWLLPESPRYLAGRPERWPELRTTLRRMGLAVQADASFVAPDTAGITRAPLRSIVQPPVAADTVALWGAFFSCLLAVYLGFSWLPTIIAEAGLGSSVASAAISIFNLGGVVGAITGGISIARYGSRSTMLTLSAGAVAGSLALSATSFDARSNVVMVLMLLGVTGGFINAVQTTMYALAAHVYPTAIRATGVGAAVSIGRIGAIVSGYAGPWALAAGGTTSFFLLMATAMSTTFVALAIVRRHVAPSRG
jgi:AAHS family 4-hydroxybenzoate transporter-like MFS transporter